jgi:rod shape-determining protein MreC
VKEFLRKKGIKLAVAVVLVALLVVFASRGLAGRAGFLTNAVGAVAEPVQKAAGAVADWLEGVYGYLYRYDQLKAENEALRVQLAEAEKEALSGAEALEENARLRNLLGYLEKHSDFVTESAKVVSRSSSNWSSSFTVSKGESSGVAVGDAVITEYGALVGQVTELGTNWATVSTVIDVDTSLGALVGNDGSAAMVVGNYALMQQGCVQLTYLAEGAQMFIGDTVTTSGAGGLFPQGITVGTVSNVQTEAGGQSEYGIITPACDIGAVSQVFIIKEFNVTE